MHPIGDGTFTKVCLGTTRPATHEGSARHGGCVPQILRRAPQHPVIVASLETTNSSEVIRECVDAGAAELIIKTATDIEDMARLTENSKHAIINARSELIKDRVNKNLVFYSRLGYPSAGFRE
jgi:hypothetical protein